MSRFVGNLEYYCRNDSCSTTRISYFMSEGEDIRRPPWENLKCPSCHKELFLNHFDVIVNKRSGIVYDADNDPNL